MSQMKTFEKLEVELYLYCRKCTKCKPKDQSIAEYARISVGRTPKGILIWCERHEEPIAHLSYDWSEVDKKISCKCEGCK